MKKKYVYDKPPAVGFRARSLSPTTKEKGVSHHISNKEGHRVPILYKNKFTNVWRPDHLPAQTERDCPICKVGFMAPRKTKRLTCSYHCHGLWLNLYKKSKK